MTEELFKREREPDEQLNIRIPRRIARKIDYNVYITGRSKKAIVSEILENATVDWPEPKITAE
jgi:predicted DNA-binding protein